MGVVSKINSTYNSTLMRLLASNISCYMIEISAVPWKKYFSHGSLHQLSCSIAFWCPFQASSLVKSDQEPKEPLTPCLVTPLSVCFRPPTFYAKPLHCRFIISFLQNFFMRKIAGAFMCFRVIVPLFPVGSTSKS